MIIDNTCDRSKQFSLNFSCFLIFLFCTTAYSNSFNASWHLDDGPNILQNSNIHLTTLSLPDLSRASNFTQKDFSTQTSIRFRPISNLSFALNWYAGSDQVLGYHIVNVGLHILCSWILFFLLQSLFRTPNLSGCCKGDEQNIALLSAVLWSIHPIQTQAVTYIVQRMTLLATLFYLSGLMLYIHGRIRTERGSRLKFFSGCLFCMLMAMGSKENAVMFPISIALIEIVFFKNFYNKAHRLISLRIIVTAMLSTGTFSILLAYSTMSQPFAFFDWMSSVRHFTLMERLLTESRVIIGYLSQIVYPLLSRFSIEHSVSVSTSLLHPITTLTSISLIIGLLAFALIKISKLPVLSFSILFYFFNHIIESTVVPLELVFEHRNHLPSAFIFFPIAMLIIKVLRYYQQIGRRPLFLFCFVVTVLFLIVLGMTTFMRNAVWTSEKTLWEDARAKAPQSARPYERLALYYNRVGQYNKALNLYETAQTKQRSNRLSLAINFGNMGSIYWQKKKFEKALKLYDEAISIDPYYTKANYNKALSLANMKKWEETINVMEYVISYAKPSWEYYSLLGFAQYKQNDYVEALKSFRKALQLSPTISDNYLNIGVCLNIMGYHKQADWFLCQSQRMSPNNIITYFCLIDNHLKPENSIMIKRYSNNLFNKFTIEQIEAGFHRFSNENMLPTVSTEALKSLLSEMLKLRTDALSHQ